MNGDCAALLAEGRIRGLMGAVDCQTGGFAESGYLALTHGSPHFHAWLTALLTIYVAAIGYRMLFAMGGTRLTDVPFMALKIGVVLALVTSWPTFQTLVADVAARAPLEVSALLTSPVGSENASPVDALQGAYDQMGRASASLGKAAGPAANAANPQAIAGKMLATAQTVLFFMSAGVLSAAKLAIAILTAVGPLFIAFCLLSATRPLFTGWVRALTAAALIPLVGWVVITMLMALLEPALAALGGRGQPSAIDPEAAARVAGLVTVFGLAQAALGLGVCGVAFAFHLPGRRERGSVVRQIQPTDNPQPVAAGAAAGAFGRGERLSQDIQRQRRGGPDEPRTAQTALVGRIVSSRSPGPSGPKAHIGDHYRRPAFNARRAVVRR
jgi:type IV secretion system protein VirB6